MNDQIPLFKVAMAAEAADRVASVLASGYIGQGSQVAAFERALEAVFDAPRPILTTNSCTSAIDLALHLCGVEPQCEDDGAAPVVISTPMTCTATNGQVVTRGARLLWADVNPHTGLIDPADVARKLALASNVKAVIAVDWGGAMCDYNALRAVCRPYGVPIIEDAAHAPLATYNGRYQTRVGGDLICWSFQAIKHLTCGDGGALLCPTDEATERARLLRWYGLDRTKGDSFRCSQDIVEVGYKYHLNDIAAAIGLANLPRLRETVHAHRQNARWLREHLSGLDGVTLPRWDPGSSWWLFTVLVEDRNGFIAHLAARGIAASPVHARNDHHTAFRSAAYGPGALPGLDRFAAREVAIPVGWWLTDSDRQRITDAVGEWSTSQAQVAERELVHA